MALLPLASHSETTQTRPAAYEADLANRLAFLQLTAADAETLRSLEPMFDASAHQFVDAFYRHLLSFEETARFLQDPQMVERLKELQREHFLSTLQADWDGDFACRRNALGQAHAKRGIEPLLFLGAYHQFVEHMFHRFAENSTEDASREREQLSSVLKAVFLDVGLTLESYFTMLNSDLRQALDMVWRANAELRQFARLASHDLKTPLGTAANLCEEVLDEFADEIPEEARLLIDRARKTVFGMSTTIDEMLSATMPVAANGGDDEVSLEEVVHEAVERIEPELKKKGIELVISEGMPRVLGSRVQLREAFYNLISNAEKYVDKRPGRIDIGVEVRQQECVVSVADNGPGIPQGELEQVFVAFRRLDVHQDQPGSGLGLYFAKSLIEQQGGRIWAESELGRGSCFYVLLKRMSGLT